MPAASSDPASLPGADDLATALQAQGHVFLNGERMQALLEPNRPLADWAAFAASWDGMPVDAYMADGGRYRRRRYGVFEATPAGIRRMAHQAHYQSLEYNPLNGGLARWFEPIDEPIAQSETLRSVLRFCHALFGALETAVAWKVQVHQFRIEAAAGAEGMPTPEGLHRDGVDYVLVMLVRRRNIASGTTTIHTPQGAPLGSFTLTCAFDAVLIDDHRVYHGVTPVQPIDTGEPAYRDVLVVTFRKL